MIRLLMRTKLMKLYRLVLIGAVCALLVGCSSRPSVVLDKEKMARLLVDIHKAEVVAETNTRVYNDSLKRVLRQSVYAKYGVTQDQVDTSLSWYGYNIKQYMEVYDRSIEILEKDLEKARETAGTTTGTSNVNVTFDGDSVDVWTAERMRRFSVDMPSNIISFNMTRDQYWEKGDAYTLRPKMVGMNGPLEVVMVVEYRDGSYDYVTRNLNGEGWQSLTLLTDSVKEARSVFGTIGYKPRIGETVFVDSITLFRSRKAPYLKEFIPNQRHFKRK